MSRWGMAKSIDGLKQLVLDAEVEKQKLELSVVFGREDKVG